MLQLPVAALLLALASAAAAQPRLVASVGTPGLGLHANWPLTPRLHARVGLNGASASRERSTSDAQFDLDVKLRSVDLLLDWHPGGTGLRLTGGLVVNRNRADATARPRSDLTYTFNGRTYSVADVGRIEGGLDFRRAAPYLGVGWDGGASATDSGWSLALDLGAMFQGRPRSSLASTGCVAPALVCTALAQDLAVENQRLADEVKNYRVYPVLRIGAGYRF